MIVIALMASPGVCSTVLVDDPDKEIYNIDTRSSSDFSTNLGTEWRLVTDQVMGGVSDGKLIVDNYQGKNCLHLRGTVSTENSGGFLQMSLPLSTEKYFDASAYAGVEFEVAGNDELYNIHFRSSDLWLPWQSYRCSFRATADWQTIRVAFADIIAYKTTAKFRKDRLKRIGLLAIGRDFQADLCLAYIRFYSADQALKTTSCDGC